ncbi:MAG: DUF92 domain-containing protein [Thermoplasmata archaeon]|jgi:uncharacterized protein (TIGR00297 family)|nr:DUF92 domain-containing protein [Euryarchaeota archaeon]
MLQDLIFLIIILLLFFISVRIGVLDIWGSTAALFLGILVYYFGGAQYLIILVSFVAISYIATVYKYRYKRDIYGMDKRRNIGSVISKGIIPMLIIFLPLGGISRFYLFSVAVAAATADTVSGELGIFSENTYSLIGLRRAVPGDEGAVSILGEFYAFLSSSSIAILYYLFSLNMVLSIYVSIFGFLGSNFDSLLGATLEKKGYMEKHSVNFIAIIISIILAYMII